MLIGGIQKTTLLDYLNKVACIVFTAGCNFRCGFCYNPELVDPALINKSVKISEKDFFDFIKSRKGILDGVVISGGEPLLQKDIKKFIIKIKAKGLLVKLDTNGTSPDKLKELIDLGLIDYAAMDVKSPLKKYEQIVQSSVKIEDILASINILKKGKIDYEFRTTVVAGLHTKEDLVKIAKTIKGAPKFYLQKFIASEKLLDPTFKDKKSLTNKDLREAADICSRYVDICEAR